MSDNKLRARTENKISVFDNCIVHGKEITLFYIINMFNYDVYTDEAKDAQVTFLYNLCCSIEEQLHGLKFSMFRFEQLASPEEYLESFIETVRLWTPDFQPSQAFIDNIQYTSENYCVIAVNASTEKAIDFNNIDIKSIFKETKDQIMDAVAGFKQNNINRENIRELSKRIENVGKGVMRPCPEKILLSYYLKRMYPSYSILVDKQDYYATETVLSYLQQDFTPHFNYFEMSNAGMGYFNAEPKTTYGTILNVVEFPEEIESGAFQFTHSGIIVNGKILDKEKARLQFKRAREDIYYEAETAQMAGSKDIELELGDYASLAEKGVALASAGRKIAEADIHILLVADTLEELQARRQELIAVLKDRQIIATFAPNQAKTYVDSFVKLRPPKYDFLVDLRYILSFQLDIGTSVMDDAYSTDFVSPVLGETTTRSEAIE